MNKQVRRLVTTLAGALVFVIVGIFLGLMLIGNSVLSGLPDPLGELFEDEGDTTTTSPVTVGALRQLHELATVEREDYVFVTRQSAGTDLGNFFTGEVVRLLAVGEVQAGINLEGLNEDDVQVNEEARTVTIDLPEARILDVNLDESQTEVFDRNLGILNSGEDSELSEEARDVAIERLEASARAGDILEEANNNAETSIRTLIRALGYREVKFE